ncbi:MAG: ABC transporter ATP-binding protein [Leptospiraceae bacterium]|nr:ABC transporter ATP-binding protein [Leptospiraceae bacterium]
MTEAAKNDALLQATSLEKSFGPLKALNGLSFAVQSGEVYGLIGPDGAGKTTALRTLIGALRPDKGNAIAGGISTVEDPESARELIGYMPQAYGLYEDLTCHENLQFFGRLQGVPRKRLEDRIRELLAFVRLENFGDRRAGALSGGMYKKLAIACSIVHEPSILILDEPTNGVDPVSRRELWLLLFTLAHQGVAILVSTPYMDEAERCNRVGLLFRGSIVREGSPATMLQDLEDRLYGVTLDDPSLSSQLARELRDLEPSPQVAYATATGVHLIASAPVHAKAWKKDIAKRARSLQRKLSFGPAPAQFEDVFMDLQAIESRSDAT